MKVFPSTKVVPQSEMPRPSMRSAPPPPLAVSRSHISPEVRASLAGEARKYVLRVANADRGARSKTTR
jgi:hypothetical protein